MADIYIDGWINPLEFLEVDQPWAPRGDATVSVEEILRYISSTADPDTLIVKYKEISIENPRLCLVPAEERILEKLIWPLKHAKASYMLGNPLGTISLCGMVAEMVAILYFDISDIKINGEKIDEQKQKLLFGCKFEKLGQDKRVKTLRCFKIISEETEEKFHKIRNIRKKYLHLWSQDHQRVSTDSIEIFKATASIVAEIIGQEVKDGRIKIKPPILRYLQRTGTYEPED